MRNKEYAELNMELIRDLRQAFWEASASQKKAMTANTSASANAAQSEYRSRLEFIETLFSKLEELVQTPLGQLAQQAVNVHKLLDEQGIYRGLGMPCDPIDSRLKAYIKMQGEGYRPVGEARHVPGGAEPHTCGFFSAHNVPDGTQLYIKKV